MHANRMNALGHLFAHKGNRVHAGRVENGANHSLVTEAMMICYDRNEKVNFKVDDVRRNKV